MRILTLLAALALFAVPAAAGGEERSGDAPCGFGCENECPLAHQANTRRAVGTEALAHASKIHADWVAVVVKNLGKI